MLSLVALVACRGDAPTSKESPPPREASGSTTPPPPSPPTVDAQPEQVPSSLACDAIFPQADRDKLVPKAYLLTDSSKHTARTADCTFELVTNSKHGWTTTFQVDVKCPEVPDVAADIDEHMARRAAFDGTPVSVEGVGRRAYRGENGESRWAIAWDDDSSCVVDVGYLPAAVDNVGVLRSVVRHIATK